MKSQLNILFAFAILLAYLIVASALFFMYGLPSLEGEIPQQMYSDSITYERAAEADSEAELELFSISGNYMGPVLVLRIFDSNRVLIHLFNLSILLLSGLIAFRYLNINRVVFLIALLSSPLLLFSTFGVNKEIFLLPVSICLLIYLQNRSFGWLFASLLLAFFVRWQVVIFVLLVMMIVGNMSPFQQRRGWALIVFLAAMTVAYPILSTDVLQTIDQISKDGAEAELDRNSSGVFAMMQEIQRSYGYFIVVIPKTIHLLIGLLGRFSIESIELDFWNSFVIMSKCVHNLILIVVVLFCRKFSLSDNYFFLICLFAAMFAITPIYAPRYLFPISIWLALWVASNENLSPIQQNRQSNPEAFESKL